MDKKTAGQICGLLFELTDKLDSLYAIGDVELDERIYALYGEANSIAKIISDKL